MSFLRTLKPFRLNPVNTFRYPLATRVTSFHTTSTFQALSESDHSHDKDERDAKIDHHKNDSIQKAKDGKGEWKAELASGSEQTVAADKHDMTMEEMQKHGAQKAQEGQQPAGSSSNTGGGSG